jgi:acyl carrier protein
MTVRVADRFGDYGLVGVLMYEGGAERYRVDTLLLSCRVLGRGVEHALVSWLGARALEEGKRFVEFGYEATAKNRPALEFINENLGASLTVPAEQLAAVKYDPDRQVEVEPEVSAPSAPQPLLRSETVQRIAEELGDTARLFKAIQGTRPVEGPPTLAALWARVLGRSSVAANENFFDAGGTSLKAVQLVALIRKELGQRLSVVSVFECPTLALLSARLNGKTETPAAVPAAMLRGQRRRQQRSARVQAT